MEDEQRLRAAVTGASGFLGRRLMAALSGDATPVARGQLEAMAGADVVFHLAGRTVVGDAWSDPTPVFEANVALTWRVLDAARDASVGLVVLASSDTVYGPDAPMPAAEDAPLRPEGPYAASKAAAEHVALAWPSPPEVVVVRFANLYGPGDRQASRLVPSVVADVLAGRAPVLRGDGSAGRDLLYVDDAVAALLAAARDGVNGEVYNAGTGTATAVREVAELAAELADAPAPVRGEGAPPGEGGSRAVDASKLRAAAGWEPLVDLRDGLARTIAAERSAVAG